MQYKIQYKEMHNTNWQDLMDEQSFIIYEDDMEAAVLRAASQAAEFHSYKYRVVAYKDPEVILTLRGGTYESL